MKSIFEEMGGKYKEENGYLIPDLKFAGNQVEWVRRMNIIKASAEEIVSTELIYK